MSCLGRAAGGAVHSLSARRHGWVVVPSLARVVASIGPFSASWLAQLVRHCFLGDGPVTHSLYRQRNRHCRVRFTTFTEFVGGCSTFFAGFRLARCHACPSSPPFPAQSSVHPTVGPRRRRLTGPNAPHAFSSRGKRSKGSRHSCEYREIDQPKMKRPVESDGHLRAQVVHGTCACAWFQRANTCAFVSRLPSDCIAHKTKAIVGRKGLGVWAAGQGPSLPVQLVGIVGRRQPETTRNRRLHVLRSVVWSRGGHRTPLPECCGVPWPRKGIFIDDHASNCKIDFRAIFFCL